MWARIEGPHWNDRPAAIVAAGPSLNSFDLQRLRDRFYVLAVKGAIFDVPWADAGTGMDNPRFREWRERFYDVTMPVYWATDDENHLGGPPYAPCVRILKRVDDSSFSDDPKVLNSGGTSGFSAMNFVWLKKATRIVLIGFDYNADAKGHANEQHYREPRQQDESRWNDWANNFLKIKHRLDQAGVKVINASPESRITAFPRMGIEEAIAAI